MAGARQHVGPPLQAHFARQRLAYLLAHAGNLDNKSLVAGTILYIPVHTRGALLEIGDGHAAQGDGEVCGTAIETPMRATVRLTLTPAGDN